CHFFGHSMGGFVGMRLAVRQPELIRSLVLVNTSASPEAHVWKYRLLIWATRLFGVRAVTPRVMPVQFGPRFLSDPARAGERRAWFERMAGNDRRGGIRAARGVIDRPDFSMEAKEVRVPTLILAGAEDRAIARAEAHKLQALIQGSELAIIPEAGHAAPIE